MRSVLFSTAVLLAFPVFGAAQVVKPADYRIPSETASAAQARLRMKDGQRLMGHESFKEAEEAFLEATILDPLLMMAHYGLGTARMAQKDYDSAVSAFEAARLAFDKRFAQDAEVAQRSEANRQTRIQILREKVRRAPEGSSTGGRTSSALRIQRQEAEAELAMLEAADLTGHGLSHPPPGLFLALGSAYFRSGRLADAEREYRATLDAQPRLGEARVNLTVVLLMTGRPAEARDQLMLAKKNGYKVPAGLERDVDSTLAAAR